MSLTWPPDGWPMLRGAPLELVDLVEIAVRAQGWADDVQARGLDADPFPLTPEEHDALREARRVFGGFMLAAEIDQFLRDRGEAS